MRLHIDLEFIIHNHQDTRITSLYNTFTILYLVRLKRNYLIQKKKKIPSIIQEV